MTEFMNLNKAEFCMENMLDLGNRDNFEEYEGIIDCVTWLCKEGLIA